jgi:MFS family permease
VEPERTSSRAPVAPAAAGAGPLGESWQAWVALGVGVLAVSAHSALSFGMSPLLKPITDELDWSRSQYAAAMNFRMVLLMAMAPVAGQLADRFGARRVLASGALLMGIGTFGIARVDSLGQMYGWSVLIGPGQACIGSVAGSALVLRLFRRRRGLAIGILNGGDNFITGGVHVASAALLLGVGWRGTLSRLGLAYVALAVLIFLVLRGRDGGPESARTDAVVERFANGGEGRASGPVRLRDLPWRDPALWLLLAAYTLIYAYITTIGIHFPAYQRDLGRSADVASYIYGLTSLIGAFGSVAWGWLAERTSARLALSLVVIGLAASTVILWLPAGLPAYYAWAVGYGVVNAGAVALLALVLAELFGADRIGRLMGVAMVFCMAGTIAGNFFAAAMYDRLNGYQQVWQAYTAMMILALWPVELLRRRSATFAPKTTSFG